jgi:hypothetical protein
MHDGDRLWRRARLSSLRSVRATAHTSWRSPLTRPVATTVPTSAQSPGAKP